MSVVGEVYYHTPFLFWRMLSVLPFRVRVYVRVRVRLGLGFIRVRVRVKVPI